MAVIFLFLLEVLCASKLTVSDTPWLPRFVIIVVCIITMIISYICMVHLYPFFNINFPVSLVFFCQNI